MSGSHGHALYVHAHSPLHTAPPQIKILTALVSVFAVVATPREAFWAFGLYAVIVGASIAVARIPIRAVATRLLVLVPFYVLALLFPIVGADPRVDVLGVSLSEPGLWDMWNLVVKATLGAAIAIVVGATTEFSDLLRGFDALHVPPVITAILAFMVRYLDVVVTDLSRMRLAILARGHRLSRPGDWGPYGKAAGALFIRTYERGERVYLAMRSRGYDGTMPASAVTATTAVDWSVAGAVAGAFVAIGVIAGLWP